VFCLKSRGPRQTQTKGRNFGENFGASSQSLENWGHSTSVDLTNTVVLRRLEVIELAEKAMSTTVAVQMIWYHHSLFNLHERASFSENHYVSACMQLHANYHKNHNKIGTKLLQAIACHCIMSLHHQIFKVIKQQHL